VKIQGVDGSFVSLQQETRARVFQESQEGTIPQASAPAAERAGVKVQDDLDHRKLEEAVGQTNKILETYSNELRFVIHEESGEIMVKVINTKDDSVIREIPPERILDFVANVKKMLGIIIDKFI